VRLLLADDHRIVREGLRWMLRDEPDIDIVAEAGNGAELLAQLREHRDHVDVVLLDIRMPGLGGLDALEQLRPRTARASPAVIVLSMHHEPFLVRRAIELGAAGYLLKSVTRRELLAALRHVAAGSSYVQAEVTGPLLDQVAGRAPPAATPTLTDRQVEVLLLVSAGKANKQVAAELGIAEDTVKTVLKDIFARLRACNRAQAVTKALQLGLIPLAEG
jgi:DNA-binding NarL/FixJ family response regulator